MTTLSDFTTELVQVQQERDSFARTLIEIRQMLGITDNGVWTQVVLKDKLDELESLRGGKPELSVVDGE